jgi:predicted transcriptional regulator
MNAAKEEVMHILERLPDDASLEDIQYHIYVRQKIDHGLEDIEAGRTLTEEEFDQRMAKWLERPAGPPYQRSVLSASETSTRSRGCLSQESTRFLPVHCPVPGRLGRYIEKSS